MRNIWPLSAERPVPRRDANETDPNHFDQRSVASEEYLSLCFVQSEPIRFSFETAFVAHVNFALFLSCYANIW
jgi:hypothetical protein